MTLILNKYHNISAGKVCIDKAIHIILMNKNKFYKMYFLFLSLFLINNVFGQDDCSLKYKADSLFTKQNYSEAINIYKQRQSQLYYNYYQLACCFCELNMPDSAEFYFNKAIEHNYYYKMGGSLNSDENLVCLHNNKNLDSLVANNHKKMFDNIDEDLKKEFLRRKISDQKVRRGEDLDSLYDIYNTPRDHITLFLFIDSINMVFLDSVIQNTGEWPGINLIGYEGDNAAFLFAQHNDRFVEFQEKCYNLLIEAYESNNTDITHIPYLYDRIMINKEAKQKYATQIRIIDNKVIFINLENEDEDYIEKLRYCYNLVSLKTYKQKLEDRYLKYEK